MTESEIASGLMPWELLALARFTKPGQSVMVVGAGTGRDMIALLERGYRVTGVEPVGVAVSRAHGALQARGLSAAIVQAYFEDAQLEGTFDILWFSYYCYSYIPERQRRIDVLRKARTHLARDGRILITYSYQADRMSPVYVKLARVSAALCRTDWRLESGDRMLRFSGRHPLYVFEHRFTPQELAEEAAAAGLTILDPGTDETPICAMTA